MARLNYFKFWLNAVVMDEEKSVFNEIRTILTNFNINLTRDFYTFCKKNVIDQF